MRIEPINSIPRLALHPPPRRELVRVSMVDTGEDFALYTKEGTNGKQITNQNGSRLYYWTDRP